MRSLLTLSFFAVVASSQAAILTQWNFNSTTSDANTSTGTTLPAIGTGTASLVGGVTATFALYVLINGAMVMGLAPVVGVPMPLLSYGGTVMLTVMIGFGLVQSVRVHRYSEVTAGRGALDLVL